MDEFLTIAQLAQGFNVSEKVIRHTFKKLLKQKKLIEGEDYIREGYRDELHFVFKIHAGRFAVHSKLIPASSPVDDLATKFATTGTQVDSQSASQDTDSGSKLDSKPDELGTKSATQPGSQGINPAREEADVLPRTESRKENELIEKLLESKDENVSTLKEHIGDLRSQLSKKDDLLAQAQSMIASMQEGQNSARDLIKMLGERVIDLSRRELPSGSNGTNLDTNTATRPNNFATKFATTSDDLGTNDEELGSQSATTPTDERAANL